VEVGGSNDIRGVVCSLLKGTSALFRLSVPTIVEIKQITHVNSDLKQTSCTKRCTTETFNIYEQCRR